MTLTFICLCLSPFILLRVPSIQKYLGNRIEKTLAEKIGSEVHIGQIDIRLPNRAIIDDIRIYDHSHRMLLKSGRMSAAVDLIPLIKDGRISLSSAQLFATAVHLYKDSINAPLNCQFLIDSLSSKDDTPSKLDLHISSLVIRNGAFTYDEPYMAPKKGKFDTHHINVSEISASILVNEITNDGIDFKVSRLSLYEKSGVRIKKFSTNANYKRTALRHDFELSNLELKMPQTEFGIPSLTASYNEQDGDIDLNSLKLNGRISMPQANINDFAALLPLQLPSSLPNTALNARIDIEKAKLNSDINLKSLNSNAFNLDTKIIAENIFDNPCIRCKITDLHASESLLKNIQSFYTLPENIANVGNVSISGNVSYCGGTTYEVQANVKSSTAGDADIKAFYEKEGNGSSFNTSLKTNGVDIARILPSAGVGRIKCDLDLKGRIDNNNDITSLYAKGNIDEVTYNDQQFTNIYLDGNYANKTFDGIINVNDPKIHFTTNAHGILNKKNIDDIDGEIYFNNIYLTEQNAKLDNVNLHLSHDADNKRIIKLQTDFAEISLTGDLKLASLPQSVSNLITKRINGIPEIGKYKPTNNDYYIDAYIDNIEFINKLVNTPLSLERPITIKGHINDNEQYADIAVNAPYIILADRKIRNTKLSLWTPLNSINATLSTTLLDNQDSININIDCIGENNGLMTSIAWDNNRSNLFRGKLNTNTQFYHTIDGKEAFSVTIPNSYFEIGDTLWSINSEKIVYADKKLDINKLNIGNDTQHLYINGIASSATQDSLTLDMKNINVKYILDLVDFHSVEFSGNASGKVIANSVFDEMNASAQLEVADFKFQNGRMGTLFADATYSNQTQKIDIDAVADDKDANAQTIIKGYVSPQQNSIDLDIEAVNTRLEFMQDFCSSFLKDVNLNGDGNVRLCGDFSHLELLGTLTAHGQLTVSSTNCRYTLPSDTIKLIPGDITFDNVTIKDIYGNTAQISGGIHHHHLSKLSYDIIAKTDKLLAYDFPTLDNSTFCGKAVIKGMVDIHGKGNELQINANATTLKDSYIIYNTTSPDAITSQDFITWGSASEISNVDSINTPSATAANDINTNSGNQRTNIRMNFLVNVSPDAKLHLIMDALTGDYIDLYGNGGLRISYYNKGAFEIFGNYDIDYGTYRMTIQNLIRRDFVFQNGSVIAFGGDPFDANLRMKALYQLNSVSLSDLNIGSSFKANNVPVNCIMNITGTAGKPLVDFNLDLPSLSNDARQMVYSIINSEESMNQQVLYLLAIGRFYSNNSEATEEHIGQTSLAMQSFLSGTFSQQLNQVLNQLINDNNWSFGANIATGTDGMSNAEYEGILRGKMLNNRLIFNGQFGYRDNIMTQNSSFIGDFDIQYLLTPNGNVSLKVYNQTNDRYFTRNSLNTQGIGMVFKKEFTLKPWFRTRYSRAKD